MVVFGAWSASVLPTMYQDLGLEMPPGFDASTLGQSMWMGMGIWGLVGAAFAALALVAGIGLLKKKEWGRVTSIVHAALVALIAVLSLFGIIAAAFLINVMAADFGGADAKSMRVATIVMLVMALVPLVGLGLGIFSGVYLLRRKTAAFFRPPPVEPSPPPVPPQTGPSTWKPASDGGTGAAGSP